MKCSINANNQSAKSFSLLLLAWFAIAKPFFVFAAVILLVAVDGFVGALFHGTNMCWNYVKHASMCQTMQLATTLMVFGATWEATLLHFATTSHAQPI